MKNILIGTDGSPDSDRALAFAANLASTSGAVLTILAVNDGNASGDQRRFGEVEHMPIGDVLENEVQTVLRQARSVATGAGVKQVSTVSETGDPAAVVLEVASGIKADVIVVGRRGRGRLAGLLLGSVSQKLATLAPCAVMIIP